MNTPVSGDETAPDTTAARNERYKDLGLAVALAFVGIGGFLFVNPTGAAVSQGPGGINWQTMPLLYSSLLLILVGFFAISTLIDLRKLSQGEQPPSLLGARPPVTGTAISNWRRVLALGCLIGYAASLQAFGFAISTLALLFIMLRVLGRKNILQNAIVAVTGTLLLWVLFIGILKLPISGDVWDPLTPVLSKLYQMTGAR